MLAVAALIAFFSSVMSQQPDGISFNSPENGINLVFPSTVAQCEPALFYYNITDPTLFSGRLGPLYSITSPDGLLYLEVFSAPDTGEGYIEWLCNLPAGSVFQIFSSGYEVYYTVQSGSASSCIGHGGFEVNQYDMSAFLATTYPPQSISSIISREKALSAILTSTTIFPTAALTTTSLSTNTPTLTSITFPAYSDSYYPSSGSSSDTSFPSSVVPNAGIIAGAVVGGVVFLASIVVTICFWGKLFQILRGRNRQPSLFQYNPPQIAQWQQQQWQPMAYQPPPVNNPVLYQPQPQPIPAMPAPQHFPSLATTSLPTTAHSPQSDSAPTQQGDQELSAALALIATRAQHNDQDRAAILSSLHGVNSLHSPSVTTSPSAGTSFPHAEPSPSSSRNIPFEKNSQRPDEQVSPPPYQETGTNEAFHAK